MSNLTKSRKQRLQACKKVLTTSLEAFTLIGDALREIRDDKLFREDGFTSWEAWLKANRAVFNLGSKGHADHLISSTKVRKEIPSPTGKTASGDVISWTEFSVRPIKKVPTTSQRVKVAKKVIAEAESTGKPITSTMVNRHIAEELKLPPKKKPEPRKERVPEFPEIISRWTDRLNEISNTIEGVPDDALTFFGRKNQRRAQELAAAIERLNESLDRVWATLP